MWWKGPAWAAVGRTGFVALLAAGAAVNAALLSGGRYVVPVTAAALVCAVALVVPRLRWPVAPWVVAAGTAWWGWLLAPLLAVSLFDLAVARRMRVALASAVVALSANLLGAQATSLWADRRWVSTLFVLLFGFVVGLWQGNRRRLVKALASEVDHLRTESQLREETARAAERSRIAAEMHDVLAHRLSLIALHTGVLATRADGLPAPVVERLALLRTTSAEALADLRDVLGALRDPDAAQGAALAPAIRDVRELAEEARAAGQHVELTVDGVPEQAPTTHRLATYRIVQEALTNVRKHAGGAAVTVRVGYRPPATLIDVTNTPGVPGTSDPGAVESGYGLVGLRERVTALGGDLDAGPAGAGAWRLAARLPHPVGIAQNGTRT
ncbi:sensor histidine kinase [Kitasatospora sp. NPDC089509]|uniref:sensor histidine kinase n=1 Tax=Kitasatospora sp. NPDC089509 TaxID=3364079 RepID=UPI00382E90A6